MPLLTLYAQIQIFMPHPLFTKMDACGLVHVMRNSDLLLEQFVTPAARMARRRVRG